jgi:predicted signal transduction protein with EAL and GGDEF domain
VPAAKDPKTGLVPPARFIPILEETRLIHEVGRWALGKAIEDYQRRRSAGLPAVRIAVNVSPLQLRSRRFVAQIEEAIGTSAAATAGSGYRPMGNGVPLDSHFRKSRSHSTQACLLSADTC